MSEVRKRVSWLDSRHSAVSLGVWIEQKHFKQREEKA